MQTNRRKLLTQLAGAALLAACGDVAKATTKLAGAADTADAGAVADGNSADVALDSAPVDSAPVDSAVDTSAAGDAAATGLVQDPAGPTAAITPNAQHYVTSCCSSPTFDPNVWALQILDHGKVLLTLSWAQLDALPAKIKEHTLECIGTGPFSQSVSNALWTGLPLAELLAQFGVAVPVAKFLKITGMDGYSTGLPATDVQRPLWLVWRMNGAELPLEHGRPARLLVPGRYGMKNPKWLQVIEFTDDPHKGFWESQGWSDTAVYQAHTYIRWPRGPENLAIGTLRIHGIAYAGSDPVAKVEIRIDGGDWQPATIDYAPGPDIWTLWHLDWPSSHGTHVVQARCTTSGGVTSSANPDGNDYSDGYDGSMMVSFAVQ